MILRALDSVGNLSRLELQVVSRSRYFNGTALILFEKARHLGIRQIPYVPRKIHSGSSSRQPSFHPVTSKGFNLAQQYMKLSSTNSRNGKMF